MRAALDALRSRGLEFTLGDLVVRGAEARLTELEQDGHHAALRRRLADSLRDGTHGLDPAALEETRERGWTRAS